MFKPYYTYISTRSIAITALLFVFIPLQILAQDNNDFETWTSAELQYRPAKRWSTGAEFQLRLKDNSTEIDAYFIELTGAYELFKNFDLGVGLRFMRKNDNTGNVQGYENYGRFDIQASYKQEIQRLNLGYRLRYQNRDELGVSDENGDFADHTIRFKLGTEYNVKKWKLDPELSGEIFFSPSNENGEGFDKYRVTFGTEYKFKKAGRLGVFYRFEQEINTSDPSSTNILRIRYIYTLKGY